MIDDNSGQGKPAVGDVRPINASLGQRNQGVVKTPLDMDWTNLVQFVENPRVSDIEHDKFLSLPKNRPKGTPKDVFVDTQGQRKTNDRFVLFGECRDGQRDDNHLIGRDAITLDYDQDDARGLLYKLRLEAIPVPFSYVWHTTRSHSWSLDLIQPKLRIIIPLSRTVTAIEYHALVRIVSKCFPATLDEAALKPSQMMYCPIRNIDAPYQCGAFYTDAYLNPVHWLALEVPEQAKALTLHMERRAPKDDNGDYDPMINAEPPMRGIDRAAMEDALDKLDPDMEEPQWLNVGRGIHHQTRGSREGLDIWDAWSSQGQKYEDGGCAAKWDRLAVSPGVKPTRFATVLQMVQEVEAEETDTRMDRWKQRIEEATERLALEKKLPRSIGRDGVLTELARKELAKLVKARQEKLFKASLDIRAIERLMTPVEVTDTHDYTKKSELTELGNAYRMYKRFGKQLRYTSEDDCWYQWDKVYWKPTSPGWPYSLARATVEGMHLELDDMTGNARADFYAWCQRSETNGMMTAMVKLFQHLDGVLVPHSKLDSDPNLFGCGNGAIDLRDGELQRPTRDDMITVHTPVPYNPDAKCPLFEKAVADAFFDEEDMVSWFQRLIGYAMLGRPVEDFIVIPVGGGSNGKSTVIGTIQRVFGAHAKGTSSATFMTDARGSGGVSASGPNEALLRLRGSRMVYMSEPESDQQLRTSLVKSVTGGDVLTARGVHAKRSVEFEPTWVVFMPTNHKPKIKDEDNGIWRRIKLVPFTRNYETDIEVKKDPELEHKLKAEYEGILAWCVAGAIEYQRIGLGKDPRRVKDAHAAYRTDMDVLYEWLADNYVMDGSGRVPSAELWGSWQAYAQKAGVFQLVSSQKALTRRLLDRGLSLYKSGAVRGMVGLSRIAESSDRQGFLD